MAELSGGHPGIPRQEQREQKLTSTVQTVHTPNVNEQPMDKATVGQALPRADTTVLEAQSQAGPRGDQGQAPGRHGDYMHP